ncbi:unnamed protein product [Ixodes pacificus]
MCALGQCGLKLSSVDLKDLAMLVQCYVKGQEAAAEISNAWPLPWLVGEPHFLCAPLVPLCWSTQIAATTGQEFIADEEQDICLNSNAVLKPYWKVQHLWIQRVHKL